MQLSLFSLEDLANSSPSGNMPIVSQHTTSKKKAPSARKSGSPVEKAPKNTVPLKQAKEVWFAGEWWPIGDIQWYGSMQMITFSAIRDGQCQVPECRNRFDKDHAHTLAADNAGLR